ncbi:MAG TPA: hypothetical protein VGC37_10345 [Friedmanniella sp.]
MNLIELCNRTISTTEGRAAQGEATAGRLAAPSDLTPQAVSHHLDAGGSS